MKEQRSWSDTSAPKVETLTLRARVTQFVKNDLEEEKYVFILKKKTIWYVFIFSDVLYFIMFL